MKNKEKVVEKNVYEVNDNLMNIIQPSGVSFTATHTSLGENVGKLYAVTKYPFNADYGWLSPLCNLEGTSTVINYRPTDPDKLIQVFDKRISELKGNHDTIRNQSDKDKNEKAINDLRKMIKQLSVNQEPVGYVNTMLHIQNITEDKLTERIKRVSSTVSVNGCNIKNMKHRQGLGLSVIAPYGIPDERVSNIGDRNMPISTFFGGFPMANPGIYDDGGYYLGKTYNGRLVIPNMWLRNKDRTNSNWFISGPPGIGKSTTVKDILLMEYAFGTKIIMFDPEEEYVDMTKHPDINGSVVNGAGGIGGRINPLQARKTATIRQEDLDEGETFEDYMQFEGEDLSDLALYIQQLKTFFRMYFGKASFTEGVSARLEQALIELYEDFGITWDTDIDSIPNENWPYMSHLYKKVNEMYEKEKKENKQMSNYRSESHEKLSDLLFSAGVGADRLWNGPTTLKTDADFVDIVISGLLETDEKVQRAQFYNIITWAWQQLSADRQQRVLFAIDEGYLVVDPEYPDLMKYIRNMAKRLRKYEGGLMFITHYVVDVLDPAVKRYGQAIIDSACYKMIMGGDGKNLKETGELFDLSENEMNILSQKNRGQGIFFAGNVRLKLKVEVSSELLEMMGTAGGR